MTVGTITLPDARLICCFNWDEEGERSCRFELPRLSEVSDFWTGEKFGRREGWFSVNNVSPRTAVLLRVV
jgi:hypothetical protein